MSYPLPKDESRRLKKLRALNILDTPSEQEFDDFAQLAAHICGVPISAISLVDEERQWFKSTVGLDVQETSRDVAFCAHAIMQDEIFVIPDATKDERFSENPLVNSNPNIRFYAGAPLKIDEESAIGTICVIDSTPREINDSQRNALRMLSRQLLHLFKLRMQTEEITKKTEQCGFSEERYQTVANMTSDIILNFDEEQNIIFANSAVEKVLGYKPDELIGNPLSLLIPEDIRQSHQKKIGVCLRYGANMLNDSNIDFPTISKDGRNVPVKISFGENTTGRKKIFTAVIKPETITN